MRARCAATLMWTVALGGCGADGAQAGLEIELAPVPAPGGQCRADAVADLASAACARIQVCRSDDPTCADPVPLDPPASEHGAGAPSLLLSVDASGRLLFDARLAGGPHDVYVTLYDSVGLALAEGTARGIRFGQQVRVRLYQYGRSSCAGPRQTATGVTLPLARALHALTALPNGDVLVYGGVRGTPSAAPTGTGAPLEEVVEVYRADVERFEPVRGDVFRRVFFGSRLLPEPTVSDGRYRIRVVGGFTVDGDGAAVRIDANQGINDYGAPVMPVPLDAMLGTGARAESSVTLVYDPNARVLTVQPVTDTLPAAGGDGVGAFGASVGSAPALLSLTDMATAAGPAFAGKFVWIGRDGASGLPLNLATGRFGATVTRTALDADEALVWGGNAGETALVDVNARAGEVLSPLGSTAVVGGAASGMPESVAFHTATPIAGGVLLAGGIVVSCAVCPAGQGYSTMYNPRRLSVLSVAGGAVSFLGIPMGMGFSSSIFHTAEELSGTVALLGGAVRGVMGNLEPSGQAVIVRSLGAATYAVEPLVTGGLIRPRWGHASARLGGDRILVTGGFEPDRAASLFRTLQSAEVLSFGPAAASIATCGP